MSNSVTKGSGSRTRNSKALSKVEHGKVSRSEQLHQPSRRANHPPSPLGRKQDQQVSPSSREDRYFATGAPCMNQESSETASQKYAYTLDTVTRDRDVDQQNFSGLEGGPSEHIPNDRADIGYDGTGSNFSKSQSASPSTEASRHVSSRSDCIHHANCIHHATQAKPQNIFSKKMSAVAKLFTSSPESSEAKSEPEQQPNRRDEERANLQKILGEKENAIRDFKKNHTKLKEDHQRLLDRNWYLKDQQQELERWNHELRHNQDQNILRLQAEARIFKGERDSIQEKYETLIRKQQEESFKQIDSGGWLPSEDSKVIADLNRIKREMRKWAKATAIKDMELFQTIDPMESSALIEDLSQVVLLENHQLPQGLSTPTSPALLLNALLAHHIYTTIFRNPFFFLDDGLGKGFSRARVDDVLHEIYEAAQESNKQDAHIWRSQTLRFLLPALRTDSPEGSRRRRSLTEGLIAKVSERYASNFIDGSARRLLNTSGDNEDMTKLKAIYQDASTISYLLWTRRTTMTCVTLREMNNPTFDANSQYLKPHSLVRYDNHEDQLKDRPITLVVHPLLQVFGTDEGKDYESERIWASAEVWLDSKSV